MFRRLIFPKEVTDQEKRWLAKPAMLAILVLCSSMVIIGLVMLQTKNQSTLTILIGVFGILYSLLFVFVIVPSTKLLQLLKWPVTLSNAIFTGIGMKYLLPVFSLIPQIILIFISAITIIFWGRRTAYTFLLLAIVLDIGLTDWSINPAITCTRNLGFFLLGGFVIETIQRLGDTNTSHVQRLKTINEFARQISSTLDTEKVLALTSAAIQKAIEADSYFLGLVDGCQIHLHLLYDDGEFFPPSKLPLEGTLSNWVIRNQSSLFIPDLRNNVDLEGVNVVLLGQNKTNLCWMGVPMRAGRVNGIIAIGSYTPNDFNRTDLELLENLAQQAALALDNTYHHADVEAQSRLDSLTGVYNHGSIVDVLNQETDKRFINNNPLSLIMLDIDHFKQYNDNFGHLVGDQVLIKLTQTIRQNIKATDSIGRWGGEEFAIILPDTNGPQAQIVAERIRKTINALTLHDRDEKQLPFPTVSQGLAVFPDEANEVFKLLDLADQRLYVAKERGRNQIEPKVEHWKHIK